MGGCLGGWTDKDLRKRWEECVLRTAVTAVHPEVQARPVCMVRQSKANTSARWVGGWVGE